MVPADAWDPAQYTRFQAERSRPFFDLLAMVEPSAGMSIVDLGCGTGELTAILHERLGAARTLGIDKSAAMLKDAGANAASGLEFAVGAIESATDGSDFDLVFSNAALHWVADHRDLLRRLTARLRRDGQLAVQVPANHREATHTVAAHVAALEPFASALAGYIAPVHVLEPVEYARLLHALGYRQQRVELRVYGHLLESRDAVVDWVAGTTLTVYRERLSTALYTDFLAAYREHLARELEDRQPFFFPFSRILFWARR